jgi:hypothetical protein
MADKAGLECVASAIRNLKPRERLSGITFDLMSWGAITGTVPLAFIGNPQRYKLSRRRMHGATDFRQHRQTYLVREFPLNDEILWNSSQPWHWSIRTNEIFRFPDLQI